MVHSTGHASRLHRDGIVNFAGFGTDSYAKEELIAELGAFLVCTRLSIPSRTENHASYLNSWVRRLKEQPNFLLTAFSSARQAANLLTPEEYIDTDDKDTSTTKQEVVENKSQVVVSCAWVVAELTLFYLSHIEHSTFVSMTIDWLSTKQLNN